MLRKSKIVGLSLPAAVYNNLEKLIRKKHKTRSEFYREMIDVYLGSLKSDLPPSGITDIRETDLAKILEAYWLLKSKSPLKIIVIGLAIIVNKDAKVLIGARKKKDPFVENLTWVFPGGNMDSLEFVDELKKEIKQETNLEVKVNNLIHSRIHPDSGFKNVQIVALYFHCETIGISKVKSGGDLAKLKWVRPSEVFKYFTTSTSDEVTKFLYTLEKSK